MNIKYKLIYHCTAPSMPDDTVLIFNTVGELLDHLNNILEISADNLEHSEKHSPGMHFLFPYMNDLIYEIVPFDADIIDDADTPFSPEACVYYKDKYIIA